MPCWIPLPVVLYRANGSSPQCRVHLWSKCCAVREILKARAFCGQRFTSATTTRYWTAFAETNTTQRHHNVDTDIDEASIRPGGLDETAPDWISNCEEVLCHSTARHFASTRSTTECSIKKRCSQRRDRSSQEFPSRKHNERNKEFVLEYALQRFKS